MGAQVKDETLPDIFNPSSIQADKFIIYCLPRRSKMANPPSYSASGTCQRACLATQINAAEQGACAPAESSSAFRPGLTVVADQDRCLPQGYGDNAGSYSGLSGSTVDQTLPTLSLRAGGMSPEQRSALVATGKISISQEHAVRDYADLVKRKIKEKDSEDANTWFSVFVMELNEIEQEYEREHGNVRDIEFPEDIIKTFHQLFTGIMELDLEKMVKQLKHEAKEKQNFRSYEPLFEDFEKKVQDRIRALPDRWQACLIEFTENVSDQSIFQQKDIDQVRKVLKECKESPAITEDGEFRKALDRVNRFDNKGRYTRTQLSHLYKCAERVIRTLSSQSSLALPEGYTATAVCQSVEIIPEIIKQYTESLKNYARIHDSTHRVSKMIVEAFLELRGKPKCELLSLRQYLLIPAKDASSAVRLYGALHELQSTSYWQTWCSPEFKKNVKDAMDNVDNFEELRKRLDLMCQCELEDNFTRELTKDEMNALVLVQHTLGQRMVSIPVMRRVITLLTNIPSRCFAMNNHLFGTSDWLRQQNPDAHLDIRSRDEFLLAVAIEQEEGLASVKMMFDQENGDVRLILKGRKHTQTETMRLWIVNPDGAPYQPSPLNGLEVILGPESTIPLAIEGAQTKVVSYDYCSGYDRTEYNSVSQMHAAYVNAVSHYQRKEVIDKTLHEILIRADERVKEQFREIGGNPILTVAIQSEQVGQDKLSRVLLERRSLRQSMPGHSGLAQEKTRQLSASFRVQRQRQPQAQRHQSQAQSQPQAQHQLQIQSQQRQLQIQDQQLQLQIQSQQRQLQQLQAQQRQIQLQAQQLRLQPQAQHQHQSRAQPQSQAQQRQLQQLQDQQRQLQIQAQQRQLQPQAQHQHQHQHQSRAQPQSQAQQRQLQQLQDQQRQLQIQAQQRQLQQLQDQQRQLQPQAQHQHQSRAQSQSQAQQRQLQQLQDQQRQLQIQAQQRQLQLQAQRQYQPRAQPHQPQRQPQPQHARAQYASTSPEKTDVGSQGAQARPTASLGPTAGKNSVPPRDGNTSSGGGRRSMVSALFSRVAASVKKT